VAARQLVALRRFCRKAGSVAPFGFMEWFSRTCAASRVAAFRDRLSGT
jgi:hypothetical protein